MTTKTWHWQISNAAWKQVLSNHPDWYLQSSLWGFTGSTGLLLDQHINSMSFLNFRSGQACSSFTPQIWRRTLSRSLGRWLYSLQIHASLTEGHNTKAHDGHHSCNLSACATNAAKTPITLYILSQLDYCGNTQFSPESSKLCHKTHSHGIPSQLYTPPVKTVLASPYRMHQVQSCMHVLCCMNGSGPSYLSTCPHSIPYPSLLFWYSHTQDQIIQMQDAWLLFFFLLWILHLELTPPWVSTAHFFNSQNKVKNLLFTILLSLLKPVSSFLSSVCVCVLVCVFVCTLEMF